MGGKASHWSARSCDQHNCPPCRASRYRYDRVNGPPGGEGGREGVGAHFRNRVTARNRKNPLIAVIVSNPSSYLHLEYSQVYYSFSPSHNKMQRAQKGLNIQPFTVYVQHCAKFTLILRFFMTSILLQYICRYICLCVCTSNSRRC